MADPISLLAETMKVYGKKMHDNIFTATPLYAYLLAKGKTGTMNGAFINERVEVAQNTTVAFGDPRAQMSLTAQDPFRVVQWVPKTVKGLVPIMLVDQLRNSGSGKVGDILKDLVSNLEKTIKNKVGIGCFASGGTNDIDGLEAIVSASNQYGSMQDETGSVSVIDRSVTGSGIGVIWRANVNSVTGALTVSSGANSMWAMYDLCTVGGEEPDLIVTTDALFMAYNSTLQTNQRFVSEKMGALGFDSLKFRNAVVVADKNCPAGTMYFLNTDYIKIVSDPTTFGKIGTRAPHMLQDYLGDVVQAYWMGNLVCTQPRTCGKLSGKQ